jgi:hypothetical protein
MLQVGRQVCWLSHLPRHLVSCASDIWQHPFLGFITDAAPMIKLTTGNVERLNRSLTVVIQI